jgi:hypothetical protein
MAEQEQKAVVNEGPTCKCGYPLVMTAADRDFNADRLAEQKEFRKVGEEFGMGYRYTCVLCGHVFVIKRVRRKS